MSDEFYDEDDDMDTEEAYEYEDEELEGEVEEISSDDVDTVVASLTTLNEGVVSENIRSIIENAIDEILHLVYTDDELVDADEDDQDEDNALSEAA